MSLRVNVDAPASKKAYILDAARWRIAAAITARERETGPRPVFTLDHRDIYFLTLDEPVLDWRARRGVVPSVEQGRISVLMCALAEAPHAIPGWRASLERVSSRTRLRFDRAVRIPPVFLIEPQAQPTVEARSGGEAVA